MSRHHQENQYPKSPSQPKIKHTSLLLGRLGLEPCCTREDVELRWLTLVEDARKQEIEVDKITTECYEMLQDERRWIGKPQGRKKAGIDETLKIFLLENQMYSVMESPMVRQGLTGMTVEALGMMSTSALKDMGFSVRHRLQLDVALGRVDDKWQALALMLQEAGLSSFIDAFKAHEVDIHTVGLLTQEDLQEIGLTDPLYLRKFDQVVKPPKSKTSTHAMTGIGRSEDVFGFDQQGDADEDEWDAEPPDDEFPVLRLLQGMSAEQELSHAKAMIMDMHTERVDIVSRVGHELVIERMEKQRLQDLVNELQDVVQDLKRTLTYEVKRETLPTIIYLLPLVTRQGLETVEQLAGLDACITSILRACLSLPGGHAEGRVDAAIADACAYLLTILMKGSDSLKEWRERVILDDGNDPEAGLIGKLRVMVARALQMEDAMTDQREVEVQEMSKMFEEERAVTIKLLHLRKQDEADRASLRASLEKERADRVRDIKAAEMMVTEKEQTIRMIKMEVGALKKQLEERKREVDERTRKAEEDKRRDIDDRGRREREASKEIERLKAVLESKEREAGKKLGLMEEKLPGEISRLKEQNAAVDSELKKEKAQHAKSLTEKDRQIEELAEMYLQMENELETLRQMRHTSASSQPQTPRPSTPRASKPASSSAAAATGPFSNQ